MTADHSLVDHVKAQLLPLPRWEAALEQLIEQLPRCHLSAELVASQDIAILDNEQGKFRATGNAPRFAVRFYPSEQRGGWYYLEAALVRNNGNRNSSLVVETVDGTNITIPIPTNLRGSVREVFFLPANVRHLYWSPTASIGYFSQSPLLLHRITSLESFLRRLYRVLFDLWRERGNSMAADQGFTLRQAFAHLQKTYLLSADLRLKRLSGYNYETFIATHGTTRRSKLAAFGRQMRDWPRKPHLSLFMVVRCPQLPWFRETLASIAAQLYPNWELVVAADFIAHPEILSLLEACRSSLTIQQLQVNAADELSATLNLALTATRGEYVARIGQHDRLPPLALFQMAREIIAHPDCALIYSDEDSIDQHGKRHSPQFKPDWNPDLLTSYHYTGRLCLLRRERVLKIGGYRSGYPGAEEYDLCLRFSRQLPVSNIRHLPLVAYHRRIASPACADTTGQEHQRPELDIATMHQSGKRALTDFYNETGVIVDDGPVPQLYRIRHPLPGSQPLVSIIIPTRNNKEILAACIRSILKKTTYTNWEILIIDNQSNEADALAYLSEVRHHPRIHVYRYDAPFNYAAINNWAVTKAKGTLLALVNNDIEVITPEWLDEMVSHAIREKIGAVGAKLLYENGTIQHAGVILGIGGVAGHAHRFLADDKPGYCFRAVVTHNLSAVTAACLVVRKAVYNEVAGFNEDFAVAFNDVDFCLRVLTLGYRNVYTPYAKLYHHESLSRGHDDTPEKQALFLHECALMRQQWGELLNQDSAYNENLSTDFEGFMYKMR